MRPLAERSAVDQMIRSGTNDCAIARATGIPRCTVRDWRHAIANGREKFFRIREADCPICSGSTLDAVAYAYLLGLYLGDGCLTLRHRGVYQLRVCLDARYPGIIDECAQAMATVSVGRGVGRQPAPGCVQVHAFWKHWPCLFPQHGPGPKHLRTIELVSWQQEIASAHPDRLLRGLIHSDGSRTRNRVNGKIYPRYEFTNHSEGIREIFCRACAEFGVHWTHPTWKHVSVARAKDVARLDAIIGPKE